MDELLHYTAFILILVSYISSLRAFRLDMSKHFKHFSFFLLYVLIGEVFAYAWAFWLYKYTPYNYSNQWFYNLFHFVGYSFYFYFFYKILSIRNIKKVTPFFFGVYVVFAVINYGFIQGQTKLNTYSELVASAMMVFLSITYYYQLLVAKEVIPLKREPAFWLTTGIFISVLGSILALSLINIMLRLSLNKALMFIRLIQVAGLLTYTMFTIAFLCKSKQSR